MQNRHKAVDSPPLVMNWFALFLLVDLFVFHILVWSWRCSQHKQLPVQYWKVFAIHCASSTESIPSVSIGMTGCHFLVPQCTSTMCESLDTSRE